MHLLIKLISSPWFWLDMVLSVSGGVVVYCGLGVEKKAEKLTPPSDFKHDIFEDISESQKKELERGWRILMTGIVMEVIAAFGISIISGLEIADLTDKAEKAKGDAADSLIVAATAESNNLVLRSNVAALELAAEWRSISAAQTSALKIQLLYIRRFHPSPLKITVTFLADNSEAQGYANAIAKQLEQCGFKVGLTGAGGWFAMENLQFGYNDKFPIGLSDTTQMYNAFKNAGISCELKDLGNLVQYNGVNIFVGQNRPIK